jgi:hypothetical protein
MSSGVVARTRKFRRHADIWTEALVSLIFTVMRTTVGEKEVLRRPPHMAFRTKLLRRAVTLG